MPPLWGEIKGFWTGGNYLRVGKRFEIRCPGLDDVDDGRLAINAKPRTMMAGKTVRIVQSIVRPWPASGWQTPTGSRSAD